MNEPPERKTLAEALQSAHQEKVPNIEDLPDLYAPGLKVLKPLDHYPAGKPKPTPVDEWDQEGLLDPYDRFESFWAKEEARKQLVILLRAIQKAKQDAEIAEQKAARDVEIARRDAEIAEQKARQDAEIVRENAEIARLASWGIPGPLFTFTQLFATPPDWFSRKNKKRFVTWIRENDYPEDLAAQGVTRVGYERLVAQAKKARRARKTQWKADKLKEQQSLANPLPEPIKQRSARKSRVSKKKN